MDYSNIKMMAMVHDRMRYLSARQTVLAENIANVDTPGYQPKDVQAPTFKEMARHAAGGLALNVTQPGHMIPGQTKAGIHRQTQGQLFEIKPDKNAVNLEEQAMRMAQNQLDYQTTTSLYRKMTDMFRTALGNQNR
ncbi:MAG: flagellar basal body rod protein FlgB [Hyphomicrobiales bacterium]|nr:flagellar basal body rod protein FlgB [Hyphomicrobiales bacterium]